MTAVEEAFAAYARGEVSSPKVLGVHGTHGGFHIKAGILGLNKNYFVAKLNANFPGNARQHGLPTIQGVVTLCDADNGRLLALMDSIEITIVRTGAATGIAAKYLSLPNARTITICGCGNQGKISVTAINEVRKIERVFAYDADALQAKKFKELFHKTFDVVLIEMNELPLALSQSEIVVTCTSSKEAFIEAKNINPGTFIAAVGADSEDKQELSAALTASSKVVADLLTQSVTIGEAHHAIEQGLMKIDDVHAELGEIISRKKMGRTSAEEIIIFDSTGTALQDVAAAAIVYEKALDAGLGTAFSFSN
jgi:ornithine cyclodeaminase/alanine dehydrogenase-like protein (mu-crystallin family)